MATVKKAKRKNSKKATVKKVQQRRHNSGVGVVLDLAGRIGMEILLKGKISKSRLETVANQAFESEKKRKDAGNVGSLKLTAPSEVTYDFAVKNLDALKVALGINRYEE